MPHENPNWKIGKILVHTNYEFTKFTLKYRKMKQVFRYSLLLAILNFSLVFAQTAPETDWELNNLKAQVQSVKETNSTDSPIGKLDEEFEVTHFTQFNQDGNISRWTRFRNGEKEESGRFEYDLKHNRTLRIKFDAVDEELYRNLIDYQYDGDLILEKLSRNPDSEGYSKTIYHYDQASNLIEEKFFIDEELIDWKQYEYNEKNQKIGFSQLNSQGDLLFKTVYTYDAQGYLIEDKSLSNNGHVNIGKSYEYDAYGYLLKERTYSPYHQDSRHYNSKGDLILEENEKEAEVYKSEYQYQYDEKGNWIERKKYKDGIYTFTTKREIIYY